MGHAFVPNAKLFDVTTSAMPQSNFPTEINAPAGSTLAANTTYALGFDASVSADFRRTTNDSEDTTEPGWSIVHHFHTNSSGTWTKTDNQSLLMKVIGTRAPTTTFIGNTGQTALSSVATTGGYTLAEVVVKFPSSQIGGTRTPAFAIYDSKTESGTVVPDSEVAALVGCLDTGCSHPTAELTGLVVQTGFRSPSRA